MTEELEKKLNEILGMKKQLEELTTDKKMSDNKLLQKYKRQGVINKIIYNIVGIISVIAMITGLICLNLTTGKTQIVAVGTLVCAFGVGIMGELCYVVIKSKLAILQELKLFELRMTELLKK